MSSISVCGFHNVTIRGGIDYSDNTLKPMQLGCGSRSISACDNQLGSPSACSRITAILEENMAVPDVRSKRERTTDWSLLLLE